MENMSLPAVIEQTAKNMFDMLSQLADHIRALEQENEVLKQKLEAQNAAK